MFNRWFQRRRLLGRNARVRQLLLWHAAAELRESDIVPRTQFPRPSSLPQSTPAPTRMAPQPDRSSPATLAPASATQVESALIASLPSRTPIAQSPHVFAVTARATVAIW